MDTLDEVQTNMAVDLVFGLLDICQDHGWGEETKELIEYNDPDSVKDYIKECLVETNRKNLDDIASNFKWDEEYDLRYDDGGIGLFAQQVGVLLRKLKIIKPNTDVVDVVIYKKIITDTSLSVKCPSCGRHVRTDQSGYAAGELTRCDRCGVHWNVTEERTTKELA